MTNKSHGHTQRVDGKVIKSLTYKSWSAMNDRCYSDGHPWFKAYGGRGITVCERWRRGTPGAFANFLADMGERPCKEMTLDRERVNEGYHKHNCRWAGKVDQRRNQRTKALSEIDNIPF